MAGICGEEKTWKQAWRRGKQRTTDGEQRACLAALLVVGNGHVDVGDDEDDEDDGLGSEGTRWEEESVRTSTL